MRNALVIFFFLITPFVKAQITLINTGTTNHLARGCISVIGKNIMVNCGYGFFVKSYDECNTLIPMNKPTPVNFEDNLCRIDTSLMYLRVGHFPSNTSYIYKSTDGGYNWVKKFDTTGPNIPYLSDMRFFDSLNGIAPATSYRQLRTSDGGDTWVWSNGPLFAILMTEAFGDSTVIIGGPGNINMSKNMGKTWLGIGPPIALDVRIPFDFAFLNKDTLFGIVNGNASNYTSLFLSSFDGGKNWNYIERNHSTKFGYPPEITFRTLCVKSTNEIYVTASDESNTALILKSTDLGQTWSTFNTGIKAYLNDMKFLNDSVALVAGHNGILFKWSTKTAMFVGLNELKDESLGLKIYPNPVNDKLNLEFEKGIVTIDKLTIANTLGQMVFTKNEINVKEEIELSFLEAGIYYLKVETKAGQKAFKVVKD